MMNDESNEGNESSKPASLSLTQKTRGEMNDNFL